MKENYYIINGLILKKWVTENLIVKTEVKLELLLKSKLLNQKYHLKNTIVISETLYVEIVAPVAQPTDTVASDARPALA